MNSIRKYLGFIWIALALAVAYFGIKVFGIPKLVSGRQEDLVFGIIIVFILIPIIVGGLFIFGRYAIQNEYDIIDDSAEHAHYREDE